MARQSHPKPDDAPPPAATHTTPPLLTVQPSPQPVSKTSPPPPHTSRRPCTAPPLLSPPPKNPTTHGSSCVAARDGVAVVVVVGGGGGPHLIAVHTVELVRRLTQVDAAVGPPHQQPHQRGILRLRQQVEHGQAPQHDALSAHVEVATAAARCGPPGAGLMMGVMGERGVRAGGGGGTWRMWRPCDEAGAEVVVGAAAGVGRRPAGRLAATTGLPCAAGPRHTVPMWYDSTCEALAWVFFTR